MPAILGRWRLLASALVIAAGLFWLLLTFPNQPCAQCGATPEPATTLTPGVVATMDSPIFTYSPGWSVSADGADPAEPADAFAEPAGVITFTYTGDALWLLVAPGDYWAYLYATVDGQPANRLANIAGNRDGTGAAAGYTTLLAPELTGLPAEKRLRWIEVHRSFIFQEDRRFLEDEHTVRLELWRGWGQTPLRAVAVDPPENALERPDARRPLWNAPLWPGASLVLAGLWLAISALIVDRRVRQVSTISSPKITWLRMPESAVQRIGWSTLATGALLVATGTASHIWLLALLGV
ncbi:MAG: hypothetical protein ACK47M_15680, partial [Caldilinea sp.]